MKLDCYLTCPRGLEEITASDIAPYCENVKAEEGGVSFSGDLKSLYSVNYQSRTGMYALIKICEYSVKDNSDLYHKVTEYPWFEWMAHDTPLSIRSRGKSKVFPNPQFLTLKVKDAIVDNIRRKTRRRPDIDKENPIYSLFVFVDRNRVGIYLNSSGVSLSKRGYRDKVHKASLNEALAAGLVLLSGWKPHQPFYDPMCGSGTIPIEAAMIGRNLPGGYYRKEYGFQKWKNYNPRIWNTIVKEAREKILTGGRLRIYGSDNVGANIDLASKNIRKILMKQWIKISKEEFCDFSPSEDGGVVIMNPPYGQRLSEEEQLKPLYELIGDIFKQKCVNMDAFVFTGNQNLSKLIGLKAKRRYMLKNGKIDCRFIHFPIREGNYVG